MLLQHEPRVVGPDRDAHFEHSSKAPVFAALAPARDKLTHRSAPSVPQASRRRTAPPALCPNRPSPSARAAKNASGAGIRGSTAPTSSRCMPSPAIRSRCSARGAGAGPGALQRSSQIALRMLTRLDAEAGPDLWRARHRGGDPLSGERCRSMRPLSAGARRSRPPAVADRGSLRRVAGGAGVVAGHRSSAARRSSSCSWTIARPLGILARNDPRVRQLEGLEQTGRGAARVGARDASRSPSAASATRSIRGTGRRPDCFSISARTGPPRRATRAAGCSTPSATTAASR